MDRFSRYGLRRWYIALCVNADLSTGSIFMSQSAKEENARKTDVVCYYCHLNNSKSVTGLFPRGKESNLIRSFFLARMVNAMIHIVQ